MENEESYDEFFMPKMIQKALEMADLSFERAFAIDESNIAASVPDYSFMSLCEKFYTKVYADPELR